MADKHTPGPWLWGWWKWIGSGIYEFRPDSELPNGEPPCLELCNCQYGTRVSDYRHDYVLSALPGADGDPSDISIDDADARLIAAAPDLLTVCKRLAEKRPCTCGVQASHGLPGICVTCEAKAAVAKATGERENSKDKVLECDL